MSLRSPRRTRRGYEHLAGRRMVARENLSELIGVNYPYELMARDAVSAPTAGTFGRVGVVTDRRRRIRLRRGYATLEVVDDALYGGADVRSAGTKRGHMNNWHT